MTFHCVYHFVSAELLESDIRGSCRCAKIILMAWLTILYLIDEVNVESCPAVVQREGCLTGEVGAGSHWVVVPDQFQLSHVEKMEYGEARRYLFLEVPKDPISTTRFEILKDCTV
jgi:hypothetical protein